MLTKPEPKPPAAPPCLVVGGDAALREALAAAVTRAALRAIQCAGIDEMRAACGADRPSLVFFDLGLGCEAGAAAVEILTAHARGMVIQLVSQAAIASYEDVCAVGNLRLSGEAKGVKMPPVLAPPLRPDAIRKAIEEFALRPMAAKPGATLADALRKDWLELWYQPKIELATRRLTGAEGLIRMRHPQHGTVFPGQFLPGAAEGEMLKLTERVVLRALRDWEAFAVHDVPIRLAVNVPVSALTKLALADMLKRERPKAAHWPGIILEVTEDEIVKDLALANEVAAALATQNCSLAIDDFGAGYSSLARLRQLPFCELKIDRSYVTDCSTDRTNAGLCEVVVELAHRFGLKSVAEGVETTHESHKLQALGCNIGQGYLFARPMPRDSFIALLRKRRVAHAAA